MRALLAVCGALVLVTCREAPSPPGHRQAELRSAAAETATALEAARLISPLSNSVVTSRRVDFRWESAEAATIELSRTRAFVEVARSSRGSGSVVLDELEAGGWFWRVRSANGAVSAPWRLRVVPRGKEAVRQGVFTGTDVNGDGIDDLLGYQAVLLGDRAMAGAYVSMTTSPGTPCVVIDENGLGKCRHFYVPYSLGDVNGDGFDDLGERGNAELMVYWGAHTLSSPWRGEGVPLPNHGAGPTLRLGDVNGDGYADVAIPLSGPVMQRGPYQVFAGGRRGLKGTAVSIPIHLYFAGGGDLDGDGFHDVALFMADGSVALHFGGPSGLSPSPERTVLLPGARYDQDDDHERQWLGLSDLDGDGLADVIVVTQTAIGHDPPVYWILHGVRSRADIRVDHRQTYAPFGGGKRHSWVVDVDGISRDKATIVAAMMPAAWSDVIQTTFATYQRGTGLRFFGGRSADGFFDEFNRVVIMGDIDGDHRDDLGVDILDMDTGTTIVTIFPSQLKPPDLLRSPAHTFLMDFENPLRPMLEEESVASRLGGAAEIRKIRRQRLLDGTTLPPTR